MSREGSVWIGGLDEYMDEEFVQKCIEQTEAGYTGIVSIKVRLETL